jgi:hypothetical protein
MAKEILRDHSKKNLFKGGIHDIGDGTISFSTEE